MGQLGQFKNKLKLFVALSIVLFVASCGNEKEQPTDIVPPVVEVKIPTPDFNADSAYAFVKAQVDFGPRIPGTKAHENCAGYIVKKMKSYGLQVTVQKGTVQTYDKKQFSLKNIIVEYKPDLPNRI